MTPQPFRQRNTGAFQPTEESLKQYRCPDWFRDQEGDLGRLGTGVGADAGRLVRAGLYLADHPQHKFHVEHYGHPSKFGFKDIIPLWKAEKWDPDRLMALYKKAGAKYFCMIAEHHDNFDCWNSKFQRWNSVNMGPKRDIAGQWQQAARKHGLRFGMTEHLAASWWFYSAAKGADKNGPLAGVPYDGADPRYADLYWTGNEHPQENYYCPHGPAHIKQAWFDRIEDMIDRYHPDLLYSDSPLPYPDEFGRKLLAHYYNDSARRHAGRVEAVYNCKQDSQGMWVQDLERGVMDKICPVPWQTDTCVGGWYYDVNLAKAHGYKSPALVLQMLADIVSKNGNLLLNFPPRPDGTLDDDELKILDAHGRLDADQRRGDLRHAALEGLRRKPEARSRAECSTRAACGTLPSDIRFTTKGDALYALALGWPEDRKLVVKSLAKPAGTISAVSSAGRDRQAGLDANRAGPDRHAAGEEALRARLRSQDRRQAISSRRPRLSGHRARRPAAVSCCRPLRLRFMATRRNTSRAAARTRSASGPTRPISSLGTSRLPGPERFTVQITYSLHAWQRVRGRNGGAEAPRHVALDRLMVGIHDRECLVK